MLKHEVVFAWTSVFGRGLDAVNGRNHNQNHCVTVVIGDAVNPGVYGDARAGAIDSQTGQFDEAGEDTSVSCVPQALVLFNPVYDNGPKGYGHERVGEYWQDFSPMHNIRKGMPPAIVSSRSKRDPITMSARPSSSGATISGTSAGSYWLSA